MLSITTMSSIWIQELWRLLSLVVGLLFLGLLMGQPLVFLFIAVLIYLNWHLYNLYRLDRWFSNKKLAPPDAPGIWGEIFHKFHRLQQRNRKHKRKLGVIVKRFQSSTTAMPDAVVILGKKFKIEWFNKAASHLLGLQYPQDKGEPITNLIRSPDFGQYLANELEDNSSIRLPSPINPNMMLRISVIPYAGKQHLLLAQDITQIHRLEQVRRDFIANVSHELRTPLTVIQGFVETLRDVEDECLEEWQRPLFLMAQQTNRMRNLVEDVLLLSRLESESAIPIAEKVPVTEILNTIYEEAQVLSGEQNHHLTLEAPEDLIIYGCAGELRSAFSNLVFNAIRYTPPGGDINIRWYKDDKGIHFEVHDTGEGIAPEHLPRLTERFYRVDVGRSRETGGTGLGLAIVKHVLHRHQGQLQVESTLGVGSTFRCDFPLARCQSPFDE